MILIDAGERSARAFDAKLVFATQLAARGHSVAIDETTLPDALEAAQKYQAAPFLVDRADIAASAFLLIGAEVIDDDSLRTLQSCHFGAETAVWAIGRFQDRQSAISARSKLAYVLGREAGIIDLKDLTKTAFCDHAILPMLASGTGLTAKSRKKPALFVILSPDRLAEPATVAAISQLDQHSGFTLSLLLTERGSAPVRQLFRTDLPIYALTDLPPAVLAGLADIAVCLGDTITSDRQAAVVLEMMQAAKVVIDCTTTSTLLNSGAPAVRGPEMLVALPRYIEQTILTNKDEIGRFVARSGWLDRHGFDRLEGVLALPAPRRAPDHPAAARTVFLPTNGIGLGHAQRCSVIAAEMQTPETCLFAAFPSCVPMIQDRGFACVPLVQKSPDHIDTYANDLINYLRLQRVLRSSDRLVFDGGYIFASVYRLILERQMDAVWVRRGLWQSGQDNSAALGRQHIFQKVIVPGEAFDELNAPQEFGRPVYPVGPVVQSLPVGAPDAQTVRAQLREQLAHPIGQLVVTMLGGGKAADRSAQLQTLCNIFERRTDCLNLIVVWPGANVPSGLYGWKNTRVVQTRNALSLIGAADMAISAAGYNSFHEILYQSVPSILMPQMAPMMDDQERRARSASDRGLAETVLAHHLFQLEREVAAFLDDGKAAALRAKLQSTVLPPRGNAAAARLIEGDPRL